MSELPDRLNPLSKPRTTWQYKYNYAVSKYNEAVASGVDKRAAIKTFSDYTKAASIEENQKALKVMSRDYGKSLFYGAAGAAAVGGASTLAGTAGNTAASSNTNKVNYEMAGTPTGGGADVLSLIHI